MPSINSQPVLPGVYSQVQEQLLPSVTGGIRVACYIGTGRLTNLVTGEAVTRGISGNDDALAHFATVLDGTTISDQNFVTYEAGVDYSATPVSGGVEWLTGAISLTGTAPDPYASLSGLTFQVSIGGGAIQTFTFTTETTVAAVVVTINTTSQHFNASVTVTGGHNYLTLTTVPTTNSSITIENGTANAILGFVAGSLVSTPSQPALGVKYYVNYEWAKALGDGQNSFQPQFFFLQNFATVTNAMGAVGGGSVQDVAAGYPAQTANMDGAWTLPVAAQLAQQNGASIVCLMQMNPADGANASQVRACLQKLFIPNINIVVSLDAADNAMLIPDITAHVEIASNTINRLERTAFIGFSALSNPSDATMLGYATAADSNRVVVVNQTNTTYSMFIGTSQTASIVDGTMMAAALAAIRTDPAFTVSQPLTREIVSGISTINTLAQGEKVILSNAGVLIVDNISGSPKVVFGTTTNFADILDQLYQIVEISDYTAQTLRGLLDPIFIGQRLLLNTPSQVETVSGAILTTLQQSNIITGFIQPSATVNPVQPTQILLQVAINPVLELDTVLITLGLNLV
jgi:hypothetical protein